MGTYIDDEHQTLQALGPRQQRWPQTPHLRRRSGSMGLRTRFSPLAPCSQGVCDHSILGASPSNRRVAIPARAGNFWHASSSGNNGVPDADGTPRSRAAEGGQKACRPAGWL